MHTKNIALSATAVTLLSVIGCERKTTAEKVADAQQQAQTEIIEAQKNAEVAKLEAQAEADRKTLEARRKAANKIGNAVDGPSVPAPVLRNEPVHDPAAPKVGDKIKDALDIRPNEQTKDALEDAADRARAEAAAAAAKAEEAERRAEAAAKKAGQ
ncbi:MAG: hypothetical protein ACR2OZ_14835 [Verrucomicrobiales bacterium]